MTPPAAPITRYLGLSEFPGSPRKRVHRQPSIDIVRAKELVAVVVDQVSRFIA